MNDVELDSPWLTIIEAVYYTKLSRTAIEQAVRAGDVRVGGIEGKKLFRREWLDEWLTRRADEQ